MRNNAIHHRLLPLLVLFALVSLLSACGAGQLATDDFSHPNAFRISDEANIKDTEENREVLNLVDDYRVAIVERDASKLRPLVSSTYYENASTTDDQDDDYGNEKLEELYTDYLESMDEIRYDIEILAVLKEKDAIRVKYAYAWNFRFHREGKDHWDSEHDVNQLTFIQEEGAWKISEGL